MKDGGEDHALHDVMRRDIERFYVRGEEQGIEAALARVIPRPVPSIVLTLFGKSAQAVAGSLRALPGALDETVGRYPVKLELRLDPLPDFAERVAAAALVLRLGVPVILTLRARIEGGVTSATDAERRRFLDSILASLREPAPPGSLLDVEAASIAADPEGWARTLALARDRGLHLLVSHHDLELSPHRAAHLLPPGDLLDGVPGGPALLWKSATRARTWPQVLALLRAMRVGDLVERRYALMALGSIEPRLLAPFFGAPLVYAAIRAEEAAAPAQLAFADLAHVWARWGVTPDDEGLVAAAGEDGAGRPRWCLLGRPAWHSLSPALHNAAARVLGLPARYFPLELPPQVEGADMRGLVAETLASLPGLGVVAGNVTAPFKGTVAGLATRLEGDAERLAAVNSFRLEDGGLTGFNTDPTGVREALAAAAAPRDGTVLVLGAGGSAAAVLHALRDADRLVVAARSEERAAAMVARLDAAVETVPWTGRDDVARRADLVVNATPLGGEGTASPLDDGVLGAGHTVLDLVYATPTGRTRLLDAAAAEGAKTVDGLAVLLHQGAAAFRLWTDEEPPLPAMREALAAARLIPFPPGVRAKAEETEVVA